MGGAWTTNERKYQSSEARGVPRTKTKPRERKYQVPLGIGEQKLEPARERTFVVKAPRTGEEDLSCHESSTFGLDLVRETRSKPRSAKSGSQYDSRKQATKMEHRMERRTEAEKCDGTERFEPRAGVPSGGCTGKGKSQDATRRSRDTCECPELEGASGTPKATATKRKREQTSRKGPPKGGTLGEPKS
jgi:hypothetical protein